jgi:hypothetical protein
MMFHFLLKSYSEKNPHQYDELISSFRPWTHHFKWENTDEEEWRQTAEGGTEAIEDQEVEEDGDKHDKRRKVMMMMIKRE